MEKTATLNLHVNPIAKQGADERNEIRFLYRRRRCDYLRFFKGGEVIFSTLYALEHF